MSPARGMLAVLSIASALILPTAAEAGTLHTPSTTVVNDQDSIVDPANGDLLLVWRTTVDNGNDPITFCRVPLGGDQCSVTKKVGELSSNGDDGFPRIVSIGNGDFRVVSVSSAGSGVRSWLSTDNGNTWPASSTVAKDGSPGVNFIGQVSEGLFVPTSGRIYFRTENGVIRINSGNGLGFESVELNFPSGDSSKVNPGIVATSNGLLTATTRYAADPQGTTRHVIAGLNPSSSAFTNANTWVSTFTARPGVLSGGGSLAGPNYSTAQPAVFALGTTASGAPSILATPFSSTSPGTDFTLPGGPFSNSEPGDWVRSASGQEGVYRTVAWVGRESGYQRIRYANSFNGGAFTPASALYSASVPDGSSKEVRAAIDDAGHGYLTWRQGNGSRFVELTAVTDPPKPGSGTGGSGGTGGTGTGTGTGGKGTGTGTGNGTGDGTGSGSTTTVGDPTTSVVVSGGRLRFTIGGTRRVKKKRCVVANKKVSFKVTLSKSSKATLKKVGFQVNGKTKKTVKKSPFKAKVKVKKPKGKKSVKFRAVVKLGQGTKTITKKLSKKVAFCK